jgi:heat shock protein 4
LWSQVSIVSFRKGGLAVRCHTWDRDLGGRDIDELLFDHFCKEFQTRFKIDVRSNAKASFKLRSQCQRLKKVRAGAGWMCGWPASSAAA